MVILDMYRRCWACESNAPINDRCPWCGKSVEPPRPPSAEEVAATTNVQGRRKKLPVHRTYKIHPILDQIEVFCVKHKIPWTRFGWEACGNKLIVELLRDGRRPQQSTIDQLELFMREYPE